MSELAFALISPKFKNVLFATDFSPCSEAAVPYASAIAKRYGATVHMAHVIGAGTLPGPLEVPYLDGGREQRESREKLNQLACSYAFMGITCLEVLRSGPVWDVLSRIVAERNIDLIVLGAYGRCGGKHLLLGSVAERVFRCAACPVLTVGPEVHTEGRVEFGTILYATDFSPAAARALSYAVSLARIHKAKLVFLHVVREDSGVMAGEAVDEAQQKLSALAPKDPLLNCDGMARRGAAADTILAVAEEVQANLIVMGVHGGILASEHVSWPVAHQIVCRASCPVLTVRG